MKSQAASTTDLVHNSIIYPRKFTTINVFLKNINNDKKNLEKFFRMVFLSS